VVTRTVYNSDGQVSVRTDPYIEGQAVHIWATRTYYDKNDREIKSEQLKDVVIDIVGSGSNLETQLTSPGTVAWAMTTTYDDAGRVIKTTDRYGGITLNTYNRAGHLVETRTEGRDENNILVWQVTRTVYDEYGQSVESTDRFLISADGNDTVLTPSISGHRDIYDSLGRVQESQQLHDVVINIVGGESVLAQPGTVVSRTNSTFDDKGRLTESVDAGGRVTDIEYDTMGRVVAVIDNPVEIDGVTVRNRVEKEYDDYGHVRLERTNVQQSEDGSVIDRTNARETVYSYDEKGQATKTTFADGTFTETRYDAFGRPTEQIDPQGNLTTSVYDRASRLVAVVAPEVPDPQNNNQMTAPRTEYRYDALGRLVSVRDALYGHATADPLSQRETRITYDERGNQLSRTLPDGSVERSEYDDWGRKSLYVSFEGVVTQYLYAPCGCSAGRLIEQKFFADEAAYNNGQGTPAETISYGYDGLGRVIRITHDQGSSQDVWQIAFDADGRVIREVTPQGAVNYEYDQATGRRTRVFTGTSGSYAGDLADPVQDTRYDYDMFGRLSKVTVRERNHVVLTQAQVTSYDYILTGQLDRMTTPDGVITVYVYDRLYRLDELTEYLPDATPATLADNAKLAQFDYVLRADGKRRSATETFWLDPYGSGTPQPYQNTVSWTYDNDGRLTEEVFTSYDVTLSQTEHFDYDLVGNRRVMTLDKGNDGTVDQTTSYQYDANDRLLVEAADLNNDGTVDQTTTYGYTGTQETDIAVHDGGATGPRTQETTYAYNLQGQMRQAIVTNFSNGIPSSVERMSFAYDPDGIRISSLDEVDADADGVFETRTMTEYLIDRRNDTGYAQVVEETVRDAGTQAVVKKVVYDIGRDVISQATFVPGGPAAGQTAILHKDGGLSTRVVTDLQAAILAAAGVQQVYHYDAYGNALGFDPAAAVTTVLYRGEWFDSGLGMQYLRARWYEPALGRFNALDPFFGSQQDPLSFNKYLYAHGDPVNGRDPTGQFLTCMLAVGSGIDTVERGGRRHQRYPS
jgi:RHS repeat-associated protein